MAEQRLPAINGDDGAWGDILNQYIAKEHYSADTDLNAATSENGSHKTVTIRPGTTTAGTAPLKLTSGSLMNTPEAGAIEFLTDKLYFTKTTTLSTARMVITTGDTNITVGPTDPSIARTPVIGDLWIDTN